MGWRGGGARLGGGGGGWGGRRGGAAGAGALHAPSVPRVGVRAPARGRRGGRSQDAGRAARAGAGGARAAAPSRRAARCGQRHDSRSEPVRAPGGHGRRRARVTTPAGALHYPPPVRMPLSAGARAELARLAAEAGVPLKPAAHDAVSDLLAAGAPPTSVGAVLAALASSSGRQ